MERFWKSNPLKMMISQIEIQNYTDRIGIMNYTRRIR